MSLKDKMFYYEKAQSLGSQLFKENGDYSELEFEHDLNNSEKKLIVDAINLFFTWLIKKLAISSSSSA